MFECFILGDSIAVGLSQARPDCKAAVKSGVNSKSWYDQFQYNPFFRDHIFKVAIISLSTNDFYNTDTEYNLRLVRASIRASMVIWILPNAILKPEQRDIVRIISSEYQDRVRDIRSETGPDTIHPASIENYKRIMSSLLNDK